MVWILTVLQGVNNPRATTGIYSTRAMSTSDQSTVLFPRELLVSHPWMRILPRTLAGWPFDNRC